MDYCRCFRCTARLFWPNAFLSGYRYRAENRLLPSLAIVPRYRFRSSERPAVPAAQQYLGFTRIRPGRAYAGCDRIGREFGYRLAGLISLRVDGFGRIVRRVKTSCGIHGERPISSLAMADQRLSFPKPAAPAAGRSRSLGGADAAVERFEESLDVHNSQDSVEFQRAHRNRSVRSGLVQAVLQVSVRVHGLDLESASFGLCCEPLRAGLVDDGCRGRAIASVGMLIHSTRPVLLSTHRPPVPARGIAVFSWPRRGFPPTPFGCGPVALPG